MALHNRDYMGGAAPTSEQLRAANRPNPYPATIALIVINVLVYLAWCTDALAPFLVSSCIVSKDALASGHLWQLVCAGFFHADFIHLLVGCLFVFWVGKVVEPKYGARVLVALYLLGGAVTGAGAALLHGSGAASLGPSGGASGTGFYVNETHILTNAHVVDDADAVQIAVGRQGVEIVGNVMARDAELDLALIQVAARGTPVPFSPKVYASQDIFALGYGVVSGSNHRALVTKGSVSARDEVERVIVFDATVNPGNSGGPLIDAGGRWIGVVRAKSRGGQGVTSLGYAVDGNAALQWLSKHGCKVVQDERETPRPVLPESVLASVGRITVSRGFAPMANFQRSFYSFDPRVYGTSGGVWALAVFLLLYFPRREVRFFGASVPLLVLFAFFGLGDLLGGFRTHSFGVDFSQHGYHLLGGGVGFLAQRFGVGQGQRKEWGPLKRLRLWWRNTRQAPPPTIPFPGRSSEPDPPSGGSDKLDPETRARMDEILAKLSEVGIHGLSDEERAFLEEASNKLRGEG